MANFEIIFLMMRKSNIFHFSFGCTHVVSTWTQPDHLVSCISSFLLLLIYTNQMMWLVLTQAILHQFRILFNVRGYSLY